jgi:hypothetical protein
MNFKQFFTESVLSTNFKILGIELGDTEGYDTIVRDMFEDKDMYEVTFTYKNDPVGVFVWDGKKEGAFEEWGDSLANDMDERDDEEEYHKAILKAIKGWEIRHQVHPSTAEKFGELIDEL